MKVGDRVVERLHKSLPHKTLRGTVVEIVNLYPEPANTPTWEARIIFDVPSHPAYNNLRQSYAVDGVWRRI